MRLRTRRVGERLAVVAPRGGNALHRHGVAGEVEDALGLVDGGIVGSAASWLGVGRCVKRLVQFDATICSVQRGPFFGGVPRFFIVCHCSKAVLLTAGAIRDDVVAG